MSVAVSNGRVCAFAIHTIVDFGCALTEVGPASRIIKKAVFVGSFGRPHHARRRARGVEAGVCFVAFVGIAELAMDVRVHLCV